MPKLSSYQSVFRIEKPKSVDKSLQKVKQRNRPSKSCITCKLRKLKCDRETPCSSCSDRGDAGSCAYSSNSIRVRDGRDEGSKFSEAQARLQKLEEMVTGLMQSGTADAANSDEQTRRPGIVADQRSRTIPGNRQLHPSTGVSKGHLDITASSETNYLGATHWSAILENIREIQIFLEPETEGNVKLHKSLPEEADLIIDTPQSVSVADVCNDLPPRPVIDKLLSVYFNAKYLSSPVIHQKKFAREYESFWEDPYSVPFLWISILFSILHISSQIMHGTGQEVLESPNDSHGSTFLCKAGQVLASGGYHRARPYSVEALFFYGFCKFMQNEDPDADAWMIVGLSARIAMRMGYHRDPCHLPKISPFDGEMRRRTFSILQTFELLLSFQVGLPAVIHEEECDTTLPRNLFDEDFDEDCKALPSSRPDTDSTPMLYWCHKAKLAEIFRRVARHALSPRAQSYSETLKLDRELREVHAHIPPTFRKRPISSSFTDDSRMILNRMNVNLLYLKSLCILHRNYLRHDRSSPEFEYSRKTCTDAALQILQYQAEIHDASGPGGQLQHEGWMVSSLTLQDFLLSAMITCFDLYEFRKSPVATGSSLQERLVQEEKHEALRVAYEMWSSRKAFSRDARRASNVLAFILSKLPRPKVPPRQIDPPQQATTSSLQQQQHTINEIQIINNASAHVNTPPNPGWHTAPFDNVMMSDSPVDGFFAPLDFNFAGPLNNVFDDLDTIDWTLVDHYLSGQDGPERTENTKPRSTN